MAVQSESDKTARVLTTGQVARICSVAPRTVSKWFDTGQLRGYRIPGSRDRRIPLDHLVRFMKAHNIPLNGLDAGPRRVLLVDADEERRGLIRQELAKRGFEAEVADGAFQAGMLIERFRPHVVVVDASDDELDLESIATAIRREPGLSSLKLVALDSENAPHEPTPGARRGADARLSQPFSVGQLAELLDQLAE